MKGTYISCITLYITFLNRQKMINIIKFWDPMMQPRVWSLNYPNCHLHFLPHPSGRPSHLGENCHRVKLWPNGMSKSGYPSSNCLFISGPKKHSVIAYRSLPSLSFDNKLSLADVFAMRYWCGDSELTGRQSLCFLWSLNRVKILS